MKQLQLIRLFTVIVTAVSLFGCTVSVDNQDRGYGPPPHSPAYHKSDSPKGPPHGPKNFKNKGHIKKAIYKAGANGHWHMHDIDNNTIRAIYSVKGDSCTVDISYSDDNFSIAYVGSNIKGKGRGKKTHKHEEWINHLRIDIESFIKVKVL